MDPKFQSSFIPRGPVVSSSSQTFAPIKKERSIFSFIATIIFTLSVLGAAGAYGYKYYLSYSIKNMTAELEESRASIDQDSVDEILRLNNRLLATQTLIDKHLILTPILNLLETSTLKSVRFSEFNYLIDDDGLLRLKLRGEAKGYSALALQAEIFNKDTNFKNPVFSDLTLDEKGNVVFSFQADVEKNLLSYRKAAEKLMPSSAGANNATTTSSALTATSSAATTTQRTATTTPIRN